MKIKIFFLFSVFFSLRGNSYPASIFLPNSSPNYIQELSSRLLKWQQANTPYVKRMNNLEKKYFDLCINDLQTWDTLLSPKHSLQHFSISYKVEDGKKVKSSVFCAPSSLNSKAMNSVKLLTEKSLSKRKDIVFWGLQWTDGSKDSPSKLSSFWLDKKTSKDVSLFQYFGHQHKATYTPSLSSEMIGTEEKSFSKAVLSTFEINYLDKKYFGYRLKDYQGPYVFNSESEEIIRKITSEFGLVLRYFNYENNQNYEIFFP